MVECGERLYADDPAGKAAAKVMAKDAFTHVTSAPDFCARYSDCAAPMDEEH